jgi:glycosyltransferase involved in cell wall biosynthesis
MEALACGRPVLVSDIPANMEWVSEGVNGWLFPDGDTAALAQKILEIMDRRHELDAVSRAARKSAEQRADWSKNFAVLLQAYQQAVSSGQ